MRYAILDARRVIRNIIEAEPAAALELDAHYLGSAQLGIGGQYPDKDLQEPTLERRVSDLETDKADRAELDAISEAIERGLSV